MPSKWSNPLLFTRNFCDLWWIKHVYFAKTEEFMYNRDNIKYTFARTHSENQMCTQIKWLERCR